VAPGAHSVHEREPDLNDRCRSRRAEHKKVHLVGPRDQRALARWLRRTANRTPPPRSLTRTPEPLLHHRVAAVRSNLLEIAAILERGRSPDPTRVAAVRDLLANGCDSPLYNPDIHISELHATLDYIQSCL
jgi:hypothetical protein